jgi:hypothetical protein
MRRLRSVPLALVALLAAVGIVGAASLPSAAGNGLATAAEHAGKTVPVVPDAVPDSGADAAPADLPDAAGLPDAADLPDAAAHGAAVSAVAQAADTTPDTNHGADVSAVAKDNHGQATATEHRPADAGKPDTAGKPDGAGQPADPGRPANPGRP